MAKKYESLGELSLYQLKLIIELLMKDKEFNDEDIPNEIKKHFKEK